jgi:hypothetical protein
MEPISIEVDSQDNIYVFDMGAQLKFLLFLFNN